MISASPQNFESAHCNLFATKIKLIVGKENGRSCLPDTLSVVKFALEQTV